MKADTRLRNLVEKIGQLPLQAADIKLVRRRWRVDGGGKAELLVRGFWELYEQQYKGEGLPSNLVYPLYLVVMFLACLLSYSIFQ